MPIKTFDLKAWRRETLAAVKAAPQYGGLKPLERELVAHVVMKFASPAEGITASHATICEGLRRKRPGLHRDTVQRGMAALVKAGILAVERRGRAGRRGRTSNRYRVPVGSPAATTSSDVEARLRARIAELEALLDRHDLSGDLSGPSSDKSSDSSSDKSSEEEGTSYRSEGALKSPQSEGKPPSSAYRRSDEIGRDVEMSSNGSSSESSAADGPPKVRRPSNSSSSNVLEDSDGDLGEIDSPRSPEKSSTNVLESFPGLAELEPLARFALNPRLIGFDAVAAIAELAALVRHEYEWFESRGFSDGERTPLDRRLSLRVAVNASVWLGGDVPF